MGKILKIFKFAILYFVKLSSFYINLNIYYFKKYHTHQSKNSGTTWAPIIQLK